MIKYFNLLFIGVSSSKQLTYSMKEYHVLVFYILYIVLVIVFRRRRISILLLFLYSLLNLLCLYLKYFISLTLTFFYYNMLRNSSYLSPKYLRQNFKTSFFIFRRITVMFINILTFAFRLLLQSS